MSLDYRLHARCSGTSTHGSALGELASGTRPFAFPNTPRVYERDRPFIVRHLGLAFDLDVANKSLRAAAALHVERVDKAARDIALDAIGFEVASVTVDGQDTRYTYDGRVIRVELGDRDEARIAIAYTAKPRRGLYFLEPDAHYPKRPRQVWTQCQEEDARHFFPCQDRPHVKMTTELRVLVPAGWYALSNGELVAEEKPGGGALWMYHWALREPHPSYLLTLVAGEFTVLDDRAGDIPLTYVVPKGCDEEGRRTFCRTPQMIEHFAERLGVRYPWNKYAQVVVSDFIFGGMENTTATTMYEHVLLDERAAIDVTSDDLISHELAHQWFGDYVTCRDWSEGWLNEGFATYFEHVWREHHLGKDEYEFGVKVDLDAYLAEAHGRYRRPIVCQEYDAPLELFDRHLYEKGGLVLHMLRLDLGTETFFAALRRYLERHARGIVETRDLLRAFEETSGRSLGRFFDQWVHKPGHPELEVTVSWEKGLLSIVAKQTQSTADGVPEAFEMPLVVDVADAQGDVRRERFLITQKSDTFAVPCAERPSFVVIDPELRVLGELRGKLPGDMLRAQLAKAKSARGRWLAAQALASSDDPLTIAALGERLADEFEFWGVRAEAAHALGKIRAKECFTALEKTLATGHPKVRRAVVNALGRFRTTEAVALLKPHALADASYLVEAEAARALGATRQQGAFDVLVDVLDRPSWADVIRAGATDGLAQLRDDRAVPHLLARLRYGHPERARRAALAALPKLSTDRKTREAIEEELDDANPLVRIDAVRALVDVGDSKARGALRTRLDIDLDPRVRRRIREALRDLGGEGKAAAQQLRDEFERLQADHIELRARLAKVEARFDGDDKKAPTHEVAHKKAAPPKRLSPAKRRTAASKKRKG